MEKQLIDLHMHTRDSDASISIDALLEELLDKKIQIFSITEHETMINTDKAKTFAQTNHLTYIPGVELTVGLNGRRHILGYGVDANNDKLKTVMAHNEPLLLAGKEHQPHLFVSPEQAIEAIVAAGGVPILAHPGAGFYDPNYKKTIEDFMSLGIQGIECYHPDNTAEITAYCLEFCQKHDLYVTGGSDYHGDCVPSRQLGMMALTLEDLNLKKLLP